MTFPPRILYVDDDRMNIELMAYWLGKDRGYDLTTAMDGREAEELIAERTFDLFLLDYCLPDITAAGLSRKIRNIDPSVPIIVYSALDRDVDKRSALDAGANIFLIKPSDIHLIEPTIKKLLSIGENSLAGHTAPQNGHRRTTRVV